MSNPGMVCFYDPMEGRIQLDDQACMYDLEGLRRKRPGRPLNTEEK